MINENVNKFGEQTIGIHGQELPKYFENADSKTWWNYSRIGKEAPKVQSRVLLKQNQKYWATNDEMLLADKSHAEGPMDVFKLEHIPKAGEKLVPDKPSNLCHVTDESLLGLAQMKRGFKAASKWS